MNDIQQKTLLFLSNIGNVYRDEDSKEITCELELDGEKFTEDVTALLLAMHIFVQRVTQDDETDLIGFTHTLNRLAIQYCIDNQ